MKQNQTVIAKGGFGVVVATHDPTNGCFVAEKYVSDYKMFKRELGFMTQLRYVQGIMPLISYNEPEHCIRMPLMVCNLNCFIMYRAALSPTRRVRLARWVARELLQALAAVHAHGIVHFDVKPENVMLDWRHKLVLSDFGLSASVGGEIRRPLGTPGYMAPEVRRGKLIAHPSADLYSVGRTLVYVVLGEDSTRHEGMADFVAALCDEDPMRRLSAVEALKHPFLRHSPTV